MIWLYIFVCSYERDFAHWLVETVIIIFNVSSVRSQRTFGYHNVHETMGTYPIYFEDDKNIFFCILYVHAFYYFFLNNIFFQKEEKNGINKWCTFVCLQFLRNWWSSKKERKKNQRQDSTKLIKALIGIQFLQIMMIRILSL